MMKYAIVNSDLVVTLASGNIANGIPISPALDNISMNQIRFDGEKLVDASTVNDWLIDDDGRKRHPAVHGDKDWQALECNFDNDLINDAGIWRVETNADRNAVVREKQISGIKAESRRRIDLIAPEWKQINMLVRSIEIRDLGDLATDDDLVEKSAIEAVWDQIKTIRINSNAIEKMAVIPKKWHDNQYWK